MTLYNDTHKKILGFRLYRKGWNYGEGVPFDREIILRANILNNIFLSCNVKTNAFPGPDGSIMVVAYIEDKCWEFIIESDKSVSIFEETKGKVVSEQEALSFSDAIGIAIKINPHILKSEEKKGCMYYALSTHNFMTPSKKDSRLSCFYQQETKLDEREYPLSQSTVSRQKTAKFVPTLKSTTDTMETIQQSFGYSISESSHQTVT